MLPDDYKKSICQRLYRAKPIPFRKVSLPDWCPKVAECHSNVDSWVGVNPGTSAVRGWVTYVDFQIKIWLTAHSVVRDTDGQLFDITPLGDERVRPTMRFVPHVGSEQLFLSVKESSNVIECPVV